MKIIALAHIIVVIIIIVAGILVGIDVFCEKLKMNEISMTQHKQLTKEEATNVVCWSDIVTKTSVILYTNQVHTAFLLDCLQGAYVLSCL